MSQLRLLILQDIIDRAAAALSQASGRYFRFEQVRSVSNPDRRNLVARAIAYDDRGASQPVIVKATRSPGYDPASQNLLETSGLAREWVATAHLSSAAPGRDHGAALIAGDVGAGILVFEDLGEDLPSLVNPLLHGSASEAEQALLSYAAALGRLHADTVRGFEAYHATYQSIFGADRISHPLGWRVEADVNIIVKAIGHAPPASELELLSSRLAYPGPWQSLVHGDPCPDNVLLVEGRARLIDYEGARPSHALLDGIYWRMGFPTCWCAGRTPEDVCVRVDAAYRKELALSIRLALDDAAYQTELAYISAVWLFTCMSDSLDEALNADEKWGTWPVRGRLLWYLDAVVRLTDGASVLPGIRESAQAWLADLGQRWPDAAPLGLYPAFASSVAASANCLASGHQR